MHNENGKSATDTQVKNPSRTKQIISDRYGNVAFDFDGHGDPWFLLSDILRALEYDIDATPIDAVLDGYDFMSYCSAPFISVPAIYKLAYEKHGRASIEFLRWLNINMLPQIKTHAKNATITLRDIGNRIDAIAAALKKITDMMNPIIIIAAAEIQSRKKSEFAAVEKRASA